MAADVAILNLWTALGGETSFLGSQVGELGSCPDGIGYYNHFQGGSIYWSPSTGAHEVHGEIRNKWEALSWERGFLGYPVTDETGTPDGVGRYNHFQGGSIYWSPSTGAHEVHGEIRSKWEALSWERGYLGYPVTDETGTGTSETGGRYNDFQGGTIYWSPVTGRRCPRQPRSGARSAAFRRWVYRLSRRHRGRRRRADHIIRRWRRRISRQHARLGRRGLQLQHRGGGY